MNVKPRLNHGEHVGKPASCTPHRIHPLDDPGNDQDVWPLRCVAVITVVNCFSRDESSNRIVDVDEGALDAEALLYMPGKRADAVALGGVVAGRQIGHAGFARQVHGLL